MIIITSIAPVHANFERQKVSVDSWINIGMKVFSLNHQSEIEQLSSNFPEVEFIPTEETAYDVFNKHYVKISALINFAKTQYRDVMFINSDIELCGIDKFQEIRKLVKNGAFVHIIRNDFEVNHSRSSLQHYGIDGFCFNQQHLELLPIDAPFYMGQCWWDYWLPYMALINNIPMYRVISKFAFHKIHNIQFSQDFWVQMGNWFKQQYNRPEADIRKMSLNLRQDFLNNSNYL